MWPEWARLMTAPQRGLGSWLRLQPPHGIWVPAMTLTCTVGFLLLSLNLGPPRYSTCQEHLWGNPQGFHTGNGLVDPWTQGSEAAWVRATSGDSRNEILSFQVMAANQTDGDSHLNMPKLGFQMVKSGCFLLKGVTCSTLVSGVSCCVPGLEEAPGPEGECLADSAP